MALLSLKLDKGDKPMASSEELAAAVKAAAGEREGRAVLSCSAAFKIAEDLSVPVSVVGKACNETGVKIIHCQLGCFP